MPVQALAQEVACYLGLDLSSIKIKRFADGEIYVQVQARTCACVSTLHAMPGENRLPALQLAGARRAGVPGMACHAPCQRQQD